jgi:hypothetical protein
MSFYSDSTISTQILEAVVHVKNNRSEFRMPTGDFLPNLKLLDIQPAETSGANTPDLMPSVGALGCIKNLYLYDGRQELGVIRDFHKYINFKNLLNDNQYNAKVNKKLKDINLGYTSQQKSTAAHQERQTLVKDEINLELVQSFTTNNSNTSAAYLNLSECLAFLANIPVLSSKVFKDLRVVVEYHSDSAEFTTRSDKSATLDNRQPLLVVDRINEPDVASKLLSNMKNFQYVQVESDRFRVAATAAATNQSTEHVLKAFHNKSVERLRVQKNFASRDSYFTANVVNDRNGIYGSVSGNKEKIQLIADGQPVGPESEGFKLDNRGLALMTDSWGTLNLTETSMYHLGDDYETVHALVPANQLANGNQAFFGLYLGRKVAELKLQYNRTGKAGGNTDGTNTQYNSALEVQVEGEVLKAFVMVNGQYKIVYV